MASTNVIPKKQAWLDARQLAEAGGVTSACARESSLCVVGVASAD